MSIRPAFTSAKFLIPLLLSICFVVPFVLANHPAVVGTTFLVLLVLYFFPGYALLSFLGTPSGVLRILLSPVFGIAVVVTAYDAAARLSIGSLFPYLAIAFSCVGVLIFARELRRVTAPGFWKSEDLHAIVAGACSTLALAPLYWRSGRFSGAEFVFYGPAGQDPLFHVTLLQRLLHHVPPDNFIMAGLRAPVYHYFDDLTLALVFNTQRIFHLRTDVFDLYYRCYPTFLYFLLGALAYRVGRQLLSKTIGGMLGILVLLGAGGLGCLLGGVQTLAHIPHFAAVRASLFSEWTSWNGVGMILPLVHRPAHYHSLLISFSAIALLLQLQRRRVDWIAAGLLLGLMAGFNFTLAATFGISAVLAAVLLWLRRQQHDARDLAWLAVSILAGSLPVGISMLLSGFHNPAPGFPFRGPNLEFTTGLWSFVLDRILPGALVPVTALVAYIVLAYGIRLFGLKRILHADLGEPRHRGWATMFAFVFAISFVVGTFFPYKALGGVAVIFIQPAIWILALFSLVPMVAWLERRKGTLRPLLLWLLIGITWLQTLAAFNFGRRAAFSREAVNALQEIRSTARPEEVVAYAPTGLIEQPILGHATETTSFAMTALTGLNGYVSSQSYSTAFAVPGLHGARDSDVLAQAQQVYEQRRDDIESFLDGTISEAGSARLTKNHVCWVVASGNELRRVSSAVKAWKMAPDMDFFKLCQ